MTIIHRCALPLPKRPFTCSGIKDRPLRGAFGILDAFRALREPECRRRVEERRYKLKEPVTDLAQAVTPFRISGLVLLVHVTEYETKRDTMGYTLGQAAKATGKSKPTIQRAIKSGTISASKADDGSYEIDPAELHRVFPLVTDTSNTEQHLKQDVLSSETVSLQREVTLLRERLADKDGVINDLRTRLDAEAEERRRTQAQLTALLTDQRPKEEPKRRRWLSFGKR